MDSQGDICMATSDCELTVESLQASQQQQQLSACDNSSAAAGLSPSKFSARLTAHWDSQFGVQDAIEAYFKSQIVAPSPAGFDNGKGGGRSRPEEPHVDSGTECAPKWNVSTQTILSIPAFFDLAAIISDNDDGGTNNCCGEPAADWAAESSPVRPSPPLQISQLPLTPDRVVKAFQVLPSSGSPQLGQQTRPKLQPNFQPMEVIRERSYCSMDTTSDSQPASVFCTSSLQQQQQQQQQRMAASSYGDGSSFLTGSSGSMSDLVATPTAGGQLATAANAFAAVDQPSGT
uniref:Uncharacterized protein n=1 Tax=Macrostomum lignano TaxID=282301 RepID=A0A1I8IMN0_9PLAT